MSKLKVDEIRSADRSVSSTANITLADDGSTTISNGTLSAGTIGDNVTMSNKYYRTAKIDDSTALSGETYLNTASSSNPHFQAGDGDTTNLLYTDNSNIKIVRAGVYLISFQGTFYYAGTTVSRACAVRIHVGSSVNTTNLVSSSLDQLSSTQNNDDYGSATALWVGHCGANTYVRFSVQAYDNSTPHIQDQSRYCIALIRPT